MLWRFESGMLGNTLYASTAPQPFLMHFLCIPYHLMNDLLYAILLWFLFVFTIEISCVPIFMSPEEAEEYMSTKRVEAFWFI